MPHAIPVEDLSAMASKQIPVTVTFTSPGCQPPVYLAGSFSEPGWQPQEMEHELKDGEHHFHKKISVEIGGSYQYKFRLGPGDWWVLDETAPTYTDDVGNRNNLLEAPRQAPSKKDSDLTSHQEESNIPAIIVEKIDNNPVHGDDFGPNATSEQKEAHEKRAEDAEPDKTVIVPDTSDEDSARTAAEVADSAAALDREASPAPVSDTEAGRTGERRMSMTPINDVAETAAEDADSAAKIDREQPVESLRKRLTSIIDLPRSDNDGEAESDGGSGTITPWNERVPLFPHECPEVFNVEETMPPTPVTSKSRKMSIYEVEPVIPKHDPNLEVFPTEREAILDHVRSAEARHSASTTPVEGRSPVTSPLKSRSSSRVNLPTTPLLNIIREEYHEGEEQNLELPSPVSSSGQPTHDARIIDTQGDGHDSDTGKPVDICNPIERAGEFDHTESASKGKQLDERRDSKTELASGSDSEPTAIDNDRQSSAKEDKGSSTAYTAIANGSSDSKLKSRTTEIRRSSSDRPDTPISFSSKKGDDDAPTFLQLVWRTVFVGWIGGFISRICGGRRHAMLGVSAALLFLAVTPVWYYSKRTLY